MKDNNKPSTSVTPINLSQFEAKLKAEQISSDIPTFKNSYNGKFVQWLDSTGKEQWPDKLQSYKRESALHGRLTSSIIQQICGAGFTFDTSADPTLVTATKEFLALENEKGDTLFQTFSKFVGDSYLYGMGDFLVQYEANKKSIMCVNYLPMNKLRACPTDPSTHKIPGWWFCLDWSKQEGGANPRTFIPANDYKETMGLAKEYDKLMDTINLENPQENLDKIENIFASPNQRIVVNSPTNDTDNFYYPSLPVYIGGLEAIRTSISIAKYNRNAIEGGLNVDSIMTVFGMNSDKEKLKFVNEYNAQFRIRNGKKQTQFVFADNKENAPELTPINTGGEDKLYKVVNENNQTDILTAHGVTSPLLFGIKTTGQLGGAQELSDAEDIFYKNIIKPLQRQMLAPINKVMAYNKLLPLDIERLKISPQPVAKQKDPSAPVTNPEIIK